MTCNYKNVLIYKNNYSLCDSAGKIGSLVSIIPRHVLT